MKTAVAACFGASLAPLFEGSLYEEGLREALEHVLRQTRNRGRYRHIDRKFGFLRRGGEPALPAQAATLDEIVDALLRQNVLALRYSHFEGNSEQLRVEPLSILVNDHQLYLVARRLSDGRIHPFRFSRIEEADRDDATFEYPDDYDPAKLFADSFGVFLDKRMPVVTVTVRLSKRWAHYARIHRWYRSQRVEVTSDHVDVHLESVRVCPELEAWILSFGAEAEVVAPDFLRDRIRQRVLAAAERYRTT